MSQFGLVLSLGAKAQTNEASVLGSLLSDVRVSERLDRRSGEEPRKTREVSFLGSLLSDARISEKFDRRLGEEIRGTREVAEREGLQLSLVVAAAYDDNIFRTADDAEEDIVVSVAPRLTYKLGQPDGPVSLEASYEAAGILYFDNNDESRIDQRAQVRASLRRKLLRFAYEGGWANLGDPDSDVGDIADRIEWGHRVIVTWEPRRKTSGEIFAEWSQVDQDASNLNDVQEASAGANLTYRYSSKTQVGVGYEIGQVDVDGAAAQEFHRVTGSLDWRPRRKISISLDAGVEFRDFGGGESNVEPVFEGRISWRPRFGTEFYLSGYAREEASAFLDEQNFTVFGGVLGWSQRIRGPWSARIELGAEEADYLSTVGAFADREDTLVFVRATADYVLREGNTAQFFYQWTDSDSSDEDFGFANQEVGVSVQSVF